MKNPYPVMLIDECSGIDVPDLRHRIWEEGREAGRNEVIEKIGRAKILAEHPYFFDEVEDVPQ